MDIVKSKRLLEVLKGVGVPNCGIFLTDDGNRIQGITEDSMIIVFDNIEEAIEADIGVLSVAGLLSRLNLFDEEKMGVELKTKESGDIKYVNKVNVKQGRKRSTVTTTNPHAMKTIPTKYPEGVALFQTSFTKEYVDFINKMTASIKTASNEETMYVEMATSEETELDMVGISIAGGYDDYEDTIKVVDLDQEGTDFSIQWKIEPFIRVMRQAASFLKDDEEVNVSVDSNGLLQVDVGGIVVTVAPINVSIIE